jgi:hypothetical protein
MSSGTVGIMTDPNDVRYVGSQVVRRMMGLKDDDVIASTADKRYARIVEPTGVASWDHREPT